MILAIDVGNSNVVFALMNGVELVYSWRLGTDEAITECTFTDELKEAGVSPDAVTGGILSSVVPKLGDVLKENFRSVFGKELLVMGDANLDPGVTVCVDNPAEVGADRLINVVAGLHVCTPPLVIVDLGTATNLDLVNRDGAFVGGVICAGIGISLKALHTETAALPLVELGQPEFVTGKNTIDNIRSGAFYGTLSLVEGLIKRLKAEHGDDLQSIATGGFSSHFKGKTEAIDHFVPELSLIGLALIHERNSDDLRG